MARRLTLLDTYHLLVDGQKVPYDGCSEGEVCEAHSADDFPKMLGSTLGKKALDVFNSAQSEWRRYCAIGSTSKLGVTEYDITPSLLAGLMQKNAKGSSETDETTIFEHQTERLVDEYKEGFVIPRKVIVNDDLNFFGDTGKRLGQLAADTLAYTVVGKLETPGNAHDGVAFFHADHGNLRTGAQAAWYIVADPNVMPAIKVSFLNGAEMPSILMSKPEMTSVVGGADDSFDYQFDDLKFKVRFDFGVNMSQPQGMLKSLEALTAANLKAAITDFRALTDVTGKKVRVRPAILLTGASNMFTALELCNSTEIRLTGSTDAERGANNTLAGMLTPVCDDLLASS